MFRALLAHRSLRVNMGASIFFTVAVILALKARITAAVKNIDAPMLTHVWQEIEYLIDVCRVTRGARIEHL
jgi:hypothetical protein